MDIAIFRLAACGLYRKDSLDHCSPADLNLLSSLHSTPLHYAVVGGNEHTVRHLVACGANVNAFNVYRESALHWACKEGNTDIISLLLQSKASPNALDSDRNTPMHWAAEYNHGEVILLLMKHGGSSSQSITNDEGLTPLQVAKQNKSRKASRALQQGLFRRIL
jgi:ankyrin repeat protein